MRIRGFLAIGAAASVAMGAAWLAATVVFPSATAPGSSPVVWVSAPDRPTAPPANASLPRMTSRGDEPAVRPGVSRLPPIAALPDVSIAERKGEVLSVWEATIAPGDTLDRLLSQAGIEAGTRAEIAGAVGDEFDLRKISPGHRLRVVQDAAGNPKTVELVVSDGVRIRVTLGNGLTSETVRPETRVAERSGEVSVDGSIFASLAQAGVPSGFAVDLSRILGGVIDFRRDLKGEETLRLLWTERLTPSGMRVGEPQLTYASLALADTRFEVVRPAEGSGAAAIFRDGEVVRTFSTPVAGARLTSVFGMRRHPVYGDIRMHTGMDFAASLGTPVRATAAGRVAFIGRRGGYGRVVEIAHGANTVTRYTHLSGFAEGLAVDDSVDAGQMIGRVGASGLATGPNLHYEVRVSGRPVDPVRDERLAGLDTAESATDLQRWLIDARRRIAEAIGADGESGGRFTLSTKGDAT
jgi:murein DD-endopeptidase MepM/ murein hydrolase activator NlpD